MAVYINFDDFADDADAAIPADSPTWEYMSDQTNVDTNTVMGLYGWAGYRRKAAYVGNPTIQDQIFRRPSGSNSGLGEVDAFGYLEMSNAISVSGRALRCRITGGRTNRTGSDVEHGLELFNKEDYLDYLAVPSDPLASGAIVGAPYVFCTNNASSSSPVIIEQAPGNHRLTFWIFTPFQSNGVGGSGNQVQIMLQCGPTTDVLKNQLFPVGHPSYDATGRQGGHFYHYYYTQGGGWTKYVVDSHPTHSNVMNNAASYPYPGSSFRNIPGTEYCDRLNRWYLAHTPYSGITNAPYDVYYDEMEFVTDTEPQNNETINSPSVTYRPGNGEWEVGFNGKYANLAHDYGTYELRYSTSPITNANWASATPAHIQADARFGITANTTGVFSKWWPYYRANWAPFKLTTVDEAALTAGDMVYFALMDISQVGGNTTVPTDGPQGARKGGRAYDTEAASYDTFSVDQAAMALIKRFDYKIPVSGAAPDPPDPPTGGPAVNAGFDATITLPATASLDGTITHGTAFTSLWTATGPAAVSFADATAIDTVATFTMPGVYTLTLTADDSLVPVTQDTVEITVNPVVSTTNFVNFQTPEALIPPGYQLDSGADYNVGQGYGWTGGTRIARERATQADQRLDTLVFSPAGVTSTWQYDIANGSYAVTVVCGDPVYQIGPYTVTVNGLAVVNNQTTAIDTYAGVTNQIVVVTDGKITVTLYSATSSALINYIEMTPVTTGGSGGEWVATEKPPAGTSVDAGHASMVGLEGFWPMNEATIGTINDVSGNNNHGTVEGTPTVITGPYGNARRFAAAGQEYNLASTISLLDNDASGWTIIFRCKRRTGSAANDGMVLGATSVTDSFIWVRQANGVNYRPKASSVTTADVQFTGFTALEDWFTYVLRAPDANGGLAGKTLDINGQTQQVQSVGSTLFDIETIGAAYTATSFPFDGDIDYVAVYNREISDVEQAKWESTPWHVFLTAPAGNDPPVVNAGSDVAIVTPTLVTPLLGVVTDDVSATVQWELLYGPAAVVFSAPTNVSTNVTFTVVGTYGIRLTADDGSLTQFDDVVVTVSDSNLLNRRRRRWSK